ncbi:MAG TPA: hypothetical protein VJ870_18355 [Amycolatopsis sp.]|nr:hypothetical protein [Amycolatopsis sp.]
MPALLLSVALGWVAAMGMSPTYEVDGALRVTYPFATTNDDAARLQGNPYYDTAATALVLAQIAKSPDIATAVAADGGTAKYAIDDTGKAVITVTVTDPSQQNTLVTYRAIARQLGQWLNQLQAQKQIPTQFRVTVDDVVQPKDATVSNSNRLKTIIASVALGVILSVSLCVVVDYRMRRRIATAAIRAAAQGSAPPGDGGAGDGSGNGSGNGSGEATTIVPKPGAPAKSNHVGDRTVRFAPVKREAPVDEEETAGRQRDGVLGLLSWRRK